MQTLWQDLRYGARMLLKNPGFTLIAVLTLALGIGANTAIFSVVNGVLLRPLPYAAAEELILVNETRNDGSAHSVSYPTFADWRAQQTVFAGMAAYHDNALTLAGKDAPAHLQAVVVSADLFSLLGAQPLLGRNFRTEEDQPGQRVVILGHALWQKRFGADPNIIGRQLVLSGKSFTVVGVQHADFNFPVQPHPVDLWVTVAIDAEKTAGDEEPITAQRGFGMWTVLARLKPQVSEQQAQVALETIESGLAARYPDDVKGSGIRLVPLHEDVVGKTRRALLVLFGAVACVLLIACANLANLLLARGVTRHRELAVRAALGASRWRIARQLLTESLLLSLTGGTLGVLLALWGIDLLKSLSPENLPRLGEIRLDGRVLGFTLLTALVTGLALGLAPAWRAVKIELTEALKAGGRGGEGWGRNRLRSLLVVAEVAIALVLLVGAGLLINSLLRLQRVQPGFNPQQVLTFSVDLPDSRYAKPEQSIAFHQRLLERLEHLPGVRAASMIFPLPLGGSSASTRFEIAGQPLPKDKRPSAGLRTAGANYFATMGIAVRAGRDFTARDDLKAPPVVVINETLARQFFPHENPIGKRIAPGISLDAGQPPLREIVGVVADVRHSSLSAEATPELYVPYAQVPFGEMAVVVRTATDPLSFVNAARAAVSALDREVPLDEVESLETYLAASVAQPKFNTLLLALFAGVALVLTALGLYGVLSYSVNARTHEIGIRMALGAQVPDVLRLVVKEGMWLALTGVALGLTASFALTRWLASLLFEVSPTDPLTLAGVALLLALVALVACYLPARRATKVDPLTALRTE